MQAVCRDHHLGAGGRRVSQQMRPRQGQGTILSCMLLHQGGQVHVGCCWGVGKRKARFSDSHLGPRLEDFVGSPHTSTSAGGSGEKQQESWWLKDRGAGLT